MWEVLLKCHRRMSHKWIYLSRLWQSKPLAKYAHERQNTTTESTSNVKETRHRRSWKLEGHWHPEWTIFRPAINRLGMLVTLVVHRRWCNWKSSLHSARTMQLICKLDAGAEGNVISLTTYKTMFPRCNVTRDGIPMNLHPSNITAYGGHTVTYYGTCTLQVAHRN